MHGRRVALQQQRFDAFLANVRSGVFRVFSELGLGRCNGEAAEVVVSSGSQLVIGGHRGRAELFDRLLAFSVVMMGLSSALHINAMGGTDTSGVGHGLSALQTLESVLKDCANGGTMTMPPSLGGSAAP